MFNKIKNLFFKYPIQTFTYFIPAPPVRKQGYREKSFDKLIKRLTKMDFEIIDIKTQAVNNDLKSGMWVIVSIRPQSSKANDLPVSEFPNEIENESIQNLAHFPSSNDNHRDTAITLEQTEGLDLPKNDNDKEEIEGIYYID